MRTESFYSEYRSKRESFLCVMLPFLSVATRSILRKSNDRLVDYIEKARILAQAHHVMRTIPKQISA